MECSIPEEHLAPSAIPNVAASRKESVKAKVVLEGFMTAIRETTKEQKSQAALRIEGKMQELARYLDVYNAIYLADCKALKEIQTTAALESLETAQLASVKKSLASYYPTWSKIQHHQNLRPKSSISTCSTQRRSPLETRMPMSGHEEEAVGEEVQAEVETLELELPNFRIPIFADTHN